MVNKSTELIVFLQLLCHDQIWNLFRLLLPHVLMQQQNNLAMMQTEVLKAL